MEIYDIRASKTKQLANRLIYITTILQPTDSWKTINECKKKQVISKKSICLIQFEEQFMKDTFFLKTSTNLRKLDK